MQGFLKESRYPITALFALLVLTLSVVEQRRTLERIASSVESVTVAKFLRELPATAIKFTGSKIPPPNPPLTRADQLQEGQYADSFERTLRTFGRLGAVEVIGEFQPTCEGGCEFTAGMLGGGWLYFTAEMPHAEPFVTLLKNAGRDDSKHNAEDTGNSKVQTTKPGALSSPHTQRSAKSEPSPTPTPARKLYYIHVAVEKGTQTSSATISPSMEFVFTNLDTEEINGDFTMLRDVPGDVTVYYRDPSTQEWVGPTDSAHLVASGLEKSRSRGVNAPTLEASYLELRSMLDRQEVALPLVAANVRAGVFVGFAYAIAIGLAAWGSFLLRGLRRSTPSPEDEPWILVEPFRQIRRAARWDLPVAVLELVLFFAFQFLSLTAPVSIALIAIHTMAIKNVPLAVTVGLLASLLTISMVVSYLTIVRRALRAPAAL